MTNQRPIPVWFGAAGERAHQRAGRLGVSMMEPGPGLVYAREQTNRAAAAGGQDAEALGMEGRVNWTGDRDKAAADIADGKAAGATHLGEHQERRPSRCRRPPRCVGAGRHRPEVAIVCCRGGLNRATVAWSKRR